jgi:hypothetical protein
MAAESILLKTSPKIEFQLLDNGFQVIDEQTDENSGFYTYKDVQSVELNRVWFPRLSRWMRVITTFTNGVPFFPDADSYKLASVIIRNKDKKLGMWLTDVKMAKKAKELKEILDQKTELKED